MLTSHGHACKEQGRNFTLEKEGKMSVDGFLPVHEMLSGWNGKTTPEGVEELTQLAERCNIEDRRLDTPPMKRARRMRFDLKSGRMLAKTKREWM